MSQDDPKKQVIEAKQMIMTFNAPEAGRPVKSSRMSHTNTKNFGTFTPNVARKGAGYSSNKRKVEDEKLFIEGHQADLKRDSCW